MKSRKHQSGFTFIALLAVMAIVFIGLLFISTRGWGYMGYSGYHHGPSFFYWGGPNVYQNRSIRNGSVGGINNRGGGFGSGK